MRREVMKLTLKALTSWLTEKFPPSGKPFVIDLEAEAVLIIDMVPPGSGPEFSDIEHLTKDSIQQIYEWILTSVISANVGDRGWGLAAHSIRLHALEHLTDLLQRIQSPPQMVSHQGSGK